MRSLSQYFYRYSSFNYQNPYLQSQKRITSRLLYLVLVFVSMSAQTFAQKPTVQPEDYGRWEYLQTATLSPDGAWLAYRIQRVSDETELRFRPLDRDTTRVVLWGESAVFASNSKWLAWQIGMSEAERKKLEKQKKPVHKKATVLNLQTGKELKFDDIQQLAFDATGRFLALHGYPPEEPKGKGADLRLIDLDSGSETTFGNVAEFTWSDKNALLAVSIATGKDAGNGVQVFNAATGRLQSLDASGSKYRQLAWRKKGLDLAVLKSDSVASKDSTANRLLAWRGLDASSPKRFALSPVAAGLADTLEVVEHRKPEWSKDGKKLSFGLRPVKKKVEADTSATADSSNTKDKKKEDEELAGLQLWHTSDVRIFPQQKAAEKRDENRTLLAVWDLDRNKAVQIGTQLLGRAEILEGWRFGIERLSENYAWGEMFGRPYHDLWTVDLADGTRKLALEKVRYSWESASGNYLLWFDGKDYWSYEIAKSKKTNLTAALATVFADTTYDTPTDLTPPFGTGGWLKGDAAVLLYDHFDIWRVQPDGSSGQRLTQGAAEQAVHRMVDLDREEEAIDAKKPLFVSLHGEWSEKRGYGRLDPNGGVRRLVFEDKMVRALQKADSANVLVYRVEARDDSPDLFTTDMDFKRPQQATATNPWLADHAWLRAELVEFQSETGRRLQVGLLYPANHLPGRRYPMIVYTYEILSSQIHFFEPPSLRDYYNFSAWTQQGYFVLMPDIVYRPRDPGVSAIQAVRPAIRKVVEMGLVDSARVGLIGHSWGGYQATYLPTRTKLFAASVAGAPLTDFISFMGAIHWNPGIPEVDHWETGQARMEVPFWEDPDAHVRNSPIHKIHEMDTPLLMAFGDKDGVVDWDQGTEFYNFARRAGKQMVLLVYEGEDHGFRQKANQIDYHQRILEWFGHYLKGEPAPAWITKGVSFEKHKEEIRRVAEKVKMKLEK